MKPIVNPIRPMVRAWRIVALLTVASVVQSVSAGDAGAAASPASAASTILSSTRSSASSTDPLSYIPGSSRGRLSEVRRQVASLRRQFSTGSYTAKVLGTIEASGAPALALPPLPAPTRAERTQTASLPTSLRTPIAGLYAAARAAARSMGAVPVKEFRAAIVHAFRALINSDRRWAKTRFLTKTTATDASGRTATMGLERPISPLGSFSTAASRQARAAETRAALLVAEALDAYLPAIDVAAAEQRVRTGDQIDPCDMVDQTPYLCVTSAGQTTYSADEMLLIDLGGDDTYTNSAGGAPFAAPPIPADIPLSVNIDVSGDDTYDTAPVSSVAVPLGPVSGRLVIGEGASFFGGLGLLVDQAGNDTYEAHGGAEDSSCSSESDRCRIANIVVAQGAGDNSAGLLFDSVGNDSYLADGPHIPEGGRAPFTTLVAQGSSYSTGCVCAEPAGEMSSGLFDSGEGNDAYEAVALRAPASGEYQTENQFIFAQATSATSQPHTFADVLYDDGGTDAFSVAGGVRRTGFSSYEYINAAAPNYFAMAYDEAQGNGLVGKAFLLEGKGTTTYDLDIESQGVAFNWASGEQAGSLADGSVGLIDDQGGDDSYTAISRITADIRLEEGDSAQDVDGQPLDHAVGSVNLGNCTHSSAGTTCTITNEFTAQGSDVLGGVALLEDHGGNDTYDARSIEELTVGLHDAFTNPTGPPELHVSTYLPTMMYAQGAGSGFDSPSTLSILIDHAGNDTYAAVARNAAEATVSSDHAQGSPTVTAAPPTEVWGRLYQGAQGAEFDGSGTGALLDLDGTSDSFRARSDVPISTPQDPDGAFELGFNWPYFQGSTDNSVAEGAAYGILIARGTRSTFSSSPTRPTCAESPGPRGTARWMDCFEWGSSADHAPLDRPPLSPTQGYSLGYAANAPGIFGSRLTLVPVPSGEIGAAQTVSVNLKDPSGNPVAGVPIRVDLQGRLCGGIGIPTVWTASPTCGSWENLSERDTVTDAAGNAILSLPLLPSELIPSAGCQSSVTTICPDYQLFASFDGSTDQGLFPAFAQTPIVLTSGG